MKKLSFYPLFGMVDGCKLKEEQDTVHRNFKGEWNFPLFSEIKLRTPTGLQPAKDFFTG